MVLRGSAPWCDSHRVSARGLTARVDMVKRAVFIRGTLSGGCLGNVIGRGMCSRNVTDAMPRLTTYVHFLHVHIYSTSHRALAACRSLIFRIMSVELFQRRQLPR
jgi:hypothetical protein